MSRVRRLTVMWLSRPHLAAHGIPLCHDHRGSRCPAGMQSARWSHLPKLAKTSVTKIRSGQDPDNPVGTILFGKRVKSRDCERTGFYYSLLADSCDPRREVRLSNEPSVTPVLAHQVKQTTHDTHYARRPGRRCVKVCVSLSSVFIV